MALPRSSKTNLSSCFACTVVSVRGRPPAEESSPCHAGDAAFFARTASTALMLGLVPSNFLTRLTMLARVAPSCLKPTICPRVNASNRAKLVFLGMLARAKASMAQANLLDPQTQTQADCIDAGPGKQALHMPTDSTYTIHLPQYSTSDPP